MLLFNEYAESIESKTPNACLGKVLSKAVEEKVVAFYLSNNVSRMLYGKKDYVLMFVDEKREQKGFYCSA